MQAAYGRTNPPTLLPPIRLQSFEGPLDLLLHLIREKKMDIFDIPIAELTRHYMNVIERERMLNLEVAGEYLVMASTLMQIKSKMLLPKPAKAEEEEEDPRAELVDQLIQYEKLKLAANMLDALPRLGRDAFTRGDFPESEGIERPLAQAEIGDLVKAFRRVLERIGGFVQHHVFLETLSVREQMVLILERLQGGGLALDELFAAEQRRQAWVTTLLAVLELWRQGQIHVIQDRCYGPVYLQPHGHA